MEDMMKFLTQFNFKLENLKENKEIEKIKCKITFGFILYFINDILYFKILTLNSYKKLLLLYFSKIYLPFNNYKHSKVHIFFNLKKKKLNLFLFSIKIKK